MTDPGAASTTPVVSQQPYGTPAAPPVSPLNGVSAPATNAQSPAIAAVAVKAPPFYRNNPDAWFCTLESQFQLARITSEETKFHHLVSNLPEDIASVLLSSETAADYEALKDSVCNMMQKSQQEKINEILATSDLGGDKPSIFLKRLTAKMAQCGLNPSTCPDMVKATLLRCLPSEFRIALSGFQDQPPAEVASIADSMFAIQSTYGKVNAAQPAAVAAIPAKPSRSIAARPNNRDGVLPFRPGQRPVICRAHVFYGHRARTCRRWCQFPRASGHQPRILANHETTPTQSRVSSPTGRAQASENWRALPNKPQ